jgi:hypothetical protein
MLRAFGLFFLVFALLSLIVHLNGMVGFFGAGALTLFVIDLLAAYVSRDARSSKMKREPLF